MTVNASTSILHAFALQLMMLIPHMGTHILLLVLHEESSVAKDVELPAWMEPAFRPLTMVSHPQNRKAVGQSQAAHVYQREHHPQSRKAQNRSQKELVPALHPAQAFLSADLRLPFFLQ